MQTWRGIQIVTERQILGCAPSERTTGINSRRPFGRSEATTRSDPLPPGSAIRVAVEGLPDPSGASV